MFIGSLAHLLALIVGVAAHLSRPQVPGIAFRLTPDYGVASIYLKDGNFVPVARVQGAPEYQALMRVSNASSTKEETAFCRALVPVADLMFPLFGATRHFCRNADLRGTLGLLHSLKTAVETYLGTNICFAELDLDVFEDHQISVTRDALHALGLRQVHTTRPASRSMTMAQRPDPAPEYDEEPKIILSIGHSPRWYTVDLFMVEDGAIEISFPDFRSSTKMDEEHQLEEIERSLKHIFANSPSNVDLPNGIQELVVYGDDSKNESLGNLLARMLNADLVRDARVSSSAFDGANLTARSVHEDMDRNHVEMRGLSAWGCQWRSALYPASDTISGLREATNDITNTLLGGNQNSNARDEL